MTDIAFLKKNMSTILFRTVYLMCISISHCIKVINSISNY